MIKQYIELERLQRLQNSINYLDSYQSIEGVEHHIGPNINTENVKETNLLRELGKINVRRNNIIDELMSMK